MLYEQVRELEEKVKLYEAQIAANEKLELLKNEPKDLYVILWDECEVTSEYTVFANSPGEALSKINFGFIKPKLTELSIYKICSAKVLISALNSGKPIENSYEDLDFSPFGYSIRENLLEKE